MYVGKSIGEHTIDLRAEIIIKDNAQLLDVLEKVKAMDGVNDTIWSEVIEVVGRKRSIPAGLRKGDIIEAVDGKRIDDTTEILLNVRKTVNDI